MVICPEWLQNPLSFETWSLDNGYNDNLTIDRIDVNGSYSPDNCRWIPREVNSRIAGKINLIECRGMILSGKQWSAKLGIGINTINKLVRRCGIEKTRRLIEVMLDDSPLNHPTEVGMHYAWFDIYNIE